MAPPLGLIGVPEHFYMLGTVDYVVSPFCLPLLHILKCALKYKGVLTIIPFQHCCPIVAATVCYCSERRGYHIAGKATIISFVFD
mmetsp:Transcript_8242/g.20359  ORF Transcript_8242/g.20359 Transcript_8242/m.20359 type:complete len:85 (-) Transcript_8242:916-1170(-)